MEVKGWWNPKETQCFLNIIKNENVLLKLKQNSKYEKTKIYKTIHAKMVKSGYSRSIYQIQNKWKTLKVHYKKDKEKLKNNPGTKLWFHLLEDLLETNNSIEVKKADAELRISNQSKATLVNTNNGESSSLINVELRPSTSSSPDLAFVRIISLKNETNNVQYSSKYSAKKSHSDASWWRDPETKCFLEIFRKEKALEHIQNGKSQSIFDVMHAKMVKAGFTRTAEQLKNKWKTLRTIYIKNKEQLRTSGSETWFPILDDLISPKPIDQIVNCDSVNINFTEKSSCKGTEAPIEIISIDSDSESVDEITKSNIISSSENDSNSSSKLPFKIKTCYSLSQTEKISKGSACGSWWNDKETYYYLNIIKKDKALNLTSSQTGNLALSLPVFKKIHAKMVNAGSNRTLQQIINKWRSLNSIFKRQSELLIHTDRIWFPILKELLTNKNSNQFENIDDCESSQQCEEITLDSDESNVIGNLNSDLVSPSPEVNLEISSDNFNFQNSTSPMKNSFQGSWWSREETNCYLNILKEENLIKSMSDKSQKRIDSFKVLHEKMMEAGFNRSFEQIRNRWKSLKILYVKNKERSKPKCYVTKVDHDRDKLLDEIFNETEDQPSESLVENNTILSPQQREEKNALNCATPSVSSEPGSSRIIFPLLKNNSTTSQIQENSNRIDDASNNYMEQQMKFMKEMIKEEHKFIEKMIKQHKMDTAEMISTISNNMMSTMEKLIQSKPTINLSLGQILPTLMNSAVSTNDPQDKSGNGSD